MYIQRFTCVKCQANFELQLLEEGEKLPPNTVPSKPKCKRCGSEALLKPEDLSKAS